MHIEASERCFHLMVYTLSKDTLSYHCMAFQAKLEDDYVKVFLNNNNYYYVLNSLIRLDLGVLP